MRRTKSHSSLPISDQTCTIIIVISLCLWLGAVLIFLAFNANNQSTSSFNNQWNPFSQVLTSKINVIATINTQSNAKKTASASNNPSIESYAPKLSYWESISPELASTGWKPIYIHNHNVRMPIEEMDYLLETYWYPHIKNLNPSIPNKANKDSPSSTKKKQTINKQQNINSNNDEGIQDIDFSALRKSKKNKKKKKRAKMEHEQESKPQAINNAIDDDPNIKYPSDWSNPCFPSKANDIDCISQHMKYWINGVSKTSDNNPVDIKSKYVTFLKDCGGFNNIRQGFEFHAMIAWLTDRTLVLPPDTPWYLIDFGVIRRGVEGRFEHDQVAWPDNSQRIDGVSNYDIWFDLDDMNNKISVITASEFIKREYDNLKLPHKYHGGDVVNLDKNIGNQFTQWLTSKATEMSSLLPWGQLANYVAWPNKEKVGENNINIDDAWIDHRTAREYTEHLKQAPFIHFPSCVKGLPGTVLVVCCVMK